VATSSAIDRSSLIARIRLARAENVGPRTYHALMRRFGSPDAALEALPHLKQRGGAQRKKSDIPDVQAITEELDALADMGGRVLCSDDDRYPALLREIYDPPPVLTALGDCELLARPMVGMVGSRNASAAGRRFAETMARELGEAGFVVVSGLARGIDAAAHSVALKSGTVAVLAGGVDNIYPPENTELYRATVRDGLILSDQPLGLTPRAGHFPRRNRIVAGLALGVVVVEATEKSGALITARLAAENGRDVFAVPGAPQDPRARGPNRLIRDGAALVESADDVIEQLRQPGRAIPVGRQEREAEPFDSAPVTSEPETPDDGHNRLLSALGTSPVEVDELVRRCQVTPSEAQILLLELELAGRIERHPGNRISLIS
jgi:DNA processing protein